MHVVLISHCEKRVLKRTRAVLDSYALRSGEHAWLTPITAEGLAELRSLLRRSATRQTSVACFRNDGRSRMKLLWIVGNTRNFDRNGISPVATQARKVRSTFPDWARICATIATASGYGHDVGKFGKTFQKKLEAPIPQADPVRHEWLSLLVVREILAGASWDEAWSRIAKRGDADRYRDVAPFDTDLKNGIDAVLYLIATHHRLPVCDGSAIGTGAHVRDHQHKPETHCAPSARILELLQTKLDKVRAIAAPDDHLYWRAIATVARIALILADHSVSAEKLFHQEALAYANTDRASRRMNQDLNWHLEHVGHAAGDMIYKMLSLVPPALSQDAIERINEPATGRYAWQETAARALSESNRAQNTPHLVLNMAGTGAGKTRANVRAICALNEDGEVRFATALNLRTLTLQTGDAYANQLHIGKDEMACVIGDRLTQHLFEYQNSRLKEKELLADEDENAPEGELETDSEFAYADAPDWLKHFMRKHTKLEAVIGAPVLVSTIDFLIAAGEPQRQGHHALAALRIMTSDLVLDEIDGYDPKPLLAVLRLTMMAGLFGRHVVASSATLSKPVAKLLWQAYAKGIEMRGRLIGQTNFKTAIIDDRTEPLVATHANADEFLADYARHTKTMLAQLLGERYRVPYLQRVANRDLRAWGQAVRDAVATLHAEQAWTDPITGKRLSIGLVRVANTRPAVKLAKYLAGQFPHARVACYHAQHFALQRWYIESRLDHLLTRKNGDDHIWSDSEIRDFLDKSANQDLLLIVVATPVEEIGRDHDFDWAVIEPSSSQSIVQIAGRVNRHRLKTCDKPNIAILQFNRRHVENPDTGPCFVWPGLESGGSHPSHDLEQLFNWPTIEQVDARLRFSEYGHCFAKYDDAAIEKETATFFARMTSEGPHRSLWMASDTYTKSPLRDNQGVRVELALLNPDDPRTFMSKVENSKEQPSSKKLVVEDAVENAWLSLSDEELASRAQEMEVDAMRLTVTLYPPSKDQLPWSQITRHPTFGFYRRKT